MRATPTARTASRPARTATSNPRSPTCSRPARSRSCIGGDHSITYPSATAVARKYGWGKVGLLHFDAHADTADSIEGNLHSHGTPMRRLIESGAIRGRNFVQVGLRGYWPPPAVFDWMREQEMTWHLMHDVWDRGMRPVIADAIARAGDGCDWLYLSVDIDVLDPGFAPGTGTPEPGGMNPADLLRAVRSIALETPLVALDVVEVSPPYDHAETTVNAAHRVVLETLGALAAKKRAQAGGTVTRPGTAPDPATLRYPVEPDEWSRPGGPFNAYDEHDHHLSGDHEDHA